MFFKKSNREDPLSDAELISKYKSTEDNGYVGILFERYSLQIYMICRKYMKDEERSRDASMQVFEYLLKELLKYDIENFKNWLGRATRNFCLMKIRKNVSTDRKSEEYKNTELGVVEQTDYLHPNGEASEKEAELVAMEAALKELKEEQRICVELFYLKEKTYDEVASATGFTMKQVKSYIQNGKRNLQIRLTKQNE